MFDSVSSLTPHDPSPAENIIRPLAEPGKRPWETSKSGYLNWAVDQLLSKSKSRGLTSSQGGPAIGAATTVADEIAAASDVKQAQAILSASRPSYVDRMNLDG